MRKYTIDYFINKFTKIPANKWITNDYSNKAETKFCALGHCGEREATLTRKAIFTRETLALKKIFRDTRFTSITDVNDGNGGYWGLGKTPRTRILKALKSIKSKLCRQS